MDNYLAPRWPEGACAAPPAPKKPKKRRGWVKPLVIILLTAALLTGLSVGSFFFVGYLADRYMEQQGEEPQPTWSEPVPTVTPGVTEWTAAELPQAQPDPELRLNLISGEAEELSASEVYQQVLPSVVCVWASSFQGYKVGSGVAITQSGYIITNYHVIEGGMGLEIMRLSDQSVRQAALVGYDEELDLAILKAEGDDYVPARLGSSDDLQVGQTVYAIGNPMGYLYGSMSDGIVSALSDERVNELNYPGRLIQTTAALNSGNSGGALVDAGGRVVGITSAKVTGIREDVVVEGLGLAIPMSDAAPYLERILRTGRSARPSIGIGCNNQVRDGVAGIYVVEVTPGTPAVGKLKPGDFIIAANGQPATTVDNMVRQFAWLEPGDTVVLTVIRRGQEITVSVPLYDRLKSAE